jgi:hypothetical protein
VARSALHGPGRSVSLRARARLSRQGGEVTFDRYEGTFTHVGDACAFEMLLDAFQIREPGLTAIAEIIHDIDVKEGTFHRGGRCTTDLGKRSEARGRWPC